MLYERFWEGRVGMDAKERLEQSDLTTTENDASAMTTVELVHAAQRGDDQAFYELINLHKTRLYRMAWTHMRHEQDALEAVQETVTRAYIQLKKLRDARFFSTWLIRILLNVCMDELKRRGRQAPSSMELLQGIPEERVLYKQDKEGVSIEERLFLEHAVDRLEESEKQVILLKYYEDMTITDISDVLECPPGTIKTRLHRALNKLRNIMGKGSEAHG